MASVNVDFGGPRLNLSLTGKAELFSSHKFDITLSTQIDNWPMDQYATLWPKPIIPNARYWIVANISKGSFDHGEAFFKGNWLDLTIPDDIDITEGSGKVTASNGTVKYIDTMPPVEGVNAAADFDLKKMIVKITSGSVGDIHVEPFTLQMTGLDTDLQYINIPLKINGPVPPVFEIDRLPTVELREKSWSLA